MDESQEPRERMRSSSFSGRAAWLLAGLLLSTTVASVVFLLRERGNARELAASRDEMNIALRQTRTELEQLSAKMIALQAQQATVPAAAREKERVAPAPRRRQAPASAERRRPAVDPRWKKIEDSLREQQKQIASAQETAQKASDELNNRLDSTRTELTGSIARTHDELMVLQRRGERNYYEFDLVKSKQFRRTGSLGLMLRKADTKHRRYDLDLLVEDARLEKRRVNLYEPVLIYLADRPQPLELVVNQITKNEVKGYLSEPKYKKSELAASAPAADTSRPQLEPAR